MNTGKEQISAAQLTFTVVCAIQGSTLLAGFSSSVVKQDTWIAIILAYIVSLPIVGLYVLLANRFPGKTIVQITIETFGQVLGRLISSFYIFFFITLSFLNTDNMGDFYVDYIMPETPKAAFVIMFIFICIWAVRKGVETMTRYAAFFMIITFIVIIFNSLLLVDKMDFSNFLPAFSLPVKSYIQASHTVAALPYEVFAFFMMFPNLDKPSGAKKALFGGLSIATISFLVKVLRDTAVIGAGTAVYTAPTFEVIRLIQVGEVFTRMEILYATLLLILIFFKTCLVFYAAALAAAQTFNFQSYRILVPVLGVIVVVYALVTFDSTNESAYWGSNFAAVYSTFFEVLLPFITLIAVLIKRKPMKGNELA